MVKTGPPQILTTAHAPMCLTSSSSGRLLMTKGWGFRFLKMSLVLAPPHFPSKKKMFTAGKEPDRKHVFKSLDFREYCSTVTTHSQKNFFSAPGCPTSTVFTTDQKAFKRH